MNPNQNIVRLPKGETREHQIVKQCNDMARQFYRIYGGKALRTEAFYASPLPSKQACWTSAVHAFWALQQIDVNECLKTIEG